MIMSLKYHLFYVCHACTGCMKEVGLHIVGATVLFLFLFCFSYLGPWTFLVQSQIAFAEKKIQSNNTGKCLWTCAECFLFPFRFSDTLIYACRIQRLPSSRRKVSLVEKILVFCNKAFHLENVIFNNIKAQNNESKQIKSRPRTEAMSIRR